jgi:hypothetical protein
MVATGGVVQLTVVEQRGLVMMNAHAVGGLSCMMFRLLNWPS